MRTSRDPLIRYPGYDLSLRNIVRAENCYLYDESGNRYVDLESGVRCTAVGHSHPRILDVLNQQAGRIAHTGFSYAHSIVEESARKILSLHGLDDGRCAFLCSGSEAVEFGVRVAQAISARPMLLTLADSYFGAYGSAHARQQDEWFSFDWLACADCDSDGGCGDTCAHWAAIPFDRIGGFLFEPGSSSGLVRFPPEKLIRSLVAAVKAEGGLLLVNEVTTGVGRTGKWFGYQHYDLTPDIVAMGKGIGNGYPVSATAMSDKVAARMAGSNFKYAQSHQNDPLGAAIALEVVRIIEEEKLIERGKNMGVVLLDGLEEIRAGTARITDIRSRGLMAAVDLKDDAKAAFTATAQQALVYNGYLVAQRPGLNTLRIDPALTIERSDLAAFLSVMGKIVATPATAQGHLEEKGPF